MNKTRAQFDKSERSIQLAIIISLLLHMGLLFYLAITNIDPSDAPATPNKESLLLEPPAQKETEWAETKTRPSSGGAPVFFRDDYQTPAEEPNDDRNDSESTTDENPENPTKTHEEPRENMLIKESSPLEEQINIKEPTALKTEKPQPSVQKKHLPQPPTIRASNIQPRTHLPQKQLPSLAQLTQGMVNYMQENGKHSVSMMGKKNGTPTDEQLKYERYLERLNQCLHNSFVINSHKQPAYSSSDESVTVYLALNNDGSIYNLKLVKSCGNYSMDHYVMSVLRDASSSFPPVPHYLPHNPFSIQYIIGLSPSSSYR